MKLEIICLALCENNRGTGVAVRGAETALLILKAMKIPTEEHFISPFCNYLSIPSHIQILIISLS